MRRTAVHIQAVALTLLVTLFVQQGVLAQHSSRSRNSEAESRLQQLINDRRGEHWDYWETQLAPTLPPLSQPVQAFPEWVSTGYVLLTLDGDYLNSFEINNSLGTENRSSEIIEHDPKIVNYIRSSVCATLHNVEGIEAEIIKHKPKLADSTKLFCEDLRKIKGEGLAIKDDDPYLAQRMALILEYLREDAIFDRLSIAHIFLKIVKDLAAYTHVLILVPGDFTSEDSLYQWIKLIKSFPDGAALLDSKNVQFVQIPFKTKWIRDYGPIFIRNADQQVIIVDPRYQTGRESLAEKQQLARLKGIVKEVFKKLSSEEKSQSAEEKDDSDKDKTSRLFDDISPSLIAARLRQRKGDFLQSFPINVVRPPIALDGGDFFTDGNGIGFTSTKTLQLNGGSSELLDLIFQQYLGIKDMVYLQPLPGSTIKHIDMFFKVVSPDILLLGEFESGGDGVQVAALQTEAQRVLEYNLSVLKSFYESRGRKVHIISEGTEQIQKGRLNIVRVPMPGLRRPIREKLVKVDQEMVDIYNTYNPQYKAMKNAAALDEALGLSIKAFEDVKNAFNQALENLYIPDKAESVTPQPLKEICSGINLLIATLSDNHEVNTKSAVLNLNSRPFTELSQFLEDKDSLSENDRLILRSLLGKSAQATEVIITQVKDYRSELEEDREQHRKELLQLYDKYQDLSQQKKRLEEQFPHGSDIYRTFLNSLQVRTNGANLLLVPVYRGLNSMQNRAFDTFMKVYTYAYGNVKIIPVDSDYFIQLSGSIHCLTKTIPTDVEVFPDDWNFRSKLSDP